MALLPREAARTAQSALRPLRCGAHVFVSAANAAQNAAWAQAAKSVAASQARAELGQGVWIDPPVSLPAAAQAPVVPVGMAAQPAPLGAGASGMADGEIGSDDTVVGEANTNATVCSSGNLGATGNRTIISKTAQTEMCSSIAATAENAEGRIFGKACGQRTGEVISVEASLRGRTCVCLSVGTL
jgi:hypothetical protein